MNLSDGVARRCVSAGSKRRCSAPADSDQRLVAYRVAEVVVEHLEPVQVDQLPDQVGVTWAN